MYKCFVEYRIEERFRGRYLEWLKGMKKDAQGLLIYEGTDQKGLFVEVWDAGSETEGERIKEERCSERSSWSTMADWVAGGPGKIHAWVFREM